MIGREKIFSLIDDVLAKASDEATVVCRISSFDLTRYANNYIHQNLRTETVDLAIRAKVGDRIGVATTNGLDHKNVLAALRKAELIAQNSPPIPNCPPLSGKQQYQEQTTFISETADISAKQRAQAVTHICEQCKSAGATAAGFYSTGYGELAVMNTSGLHAYAPHSAAELMCIAGKGSGSGYGAAMSRDVSEIDVEATVQTALDKCLADQNKKEIKPGDFEVILEPAAVAAACEWLGHIGFGSKETEEKTSFLAGREGDRIAQENVTICDDAFHPLAMGLPFDFEGMPKQKVFFIKEGIAGGCVHDTASAARAGAKSTGHAPPPEYGDAGAISMNIVFAGGKDNMSDMVKKVEFGILVTRFHYLNGFIDPRNAVLTGMTRDGTFLIEKGRITGALPNLRFTQSFLEALQNVKQLSKEQRTTSSWWGFAGGLHTPAMHLGKFRFTGIQKDST